MLAILLPLLISTICIFFPLKKTNKQLVYIAIMCERARDQVVITTLINIITIALLQIAKVYHKIIFFLVVKLYMQNKQSTSKRALHSRK